MPRMVSGLSSGFGMGESVVVGFPGSHMLSRNPADLVRLAEQEDVAMTSPDYLPVACNDTVAMWILDQVRRSGSLDFDTAIAKIGRLFGDRFTVEVGRDAPTLRKGVLLAIRDLPKGRVGLNRRERCFRPK